MIEPLHARLDERLPATIRRRPDRAVAEDILCNVSVERFMDVVIHPVPPHEMEAQSGAFEPGGRVLIEWPSDLKRWWEVMPGDELVVEGRALRIRAICEYPPCFVELYVDAP